MTCSPFSTTSGILLVDGPLRSGMSGWYLPRFDAGRWLELVERHRPVVAFLVPAMAQLLVAHPRFADADLSSLAAVTFGGAPMARSTLRRISERLPSRRCAGGLRHDRVRRRLPHAVGRRRPPSRVGGSAPRRRRDPGRRRCRPAGGAGTGRRGHRAGTRSAAPVLQGPRQLRATWRDGWLHTGDLGYLDLDGFLWITGRAKDVIIRGGHNVVPGDVEEVLLSHPAVVDAVVVGIPHPVLGEDVAAWVVLREDSDATADDLRSFMLERLADYKVPRAIHLVDRLPRNDSGKVVRSALPGTRPAKPRRHGDSNRTRERAGARRPRRGDRCRAPAHPQPAAIAQSRSPRAASASCWPPSTRPSAAPDVRVVVIRAKGPSFSSGYGILPDDVEPADGEARPGIEGDVAAMLSLSAGWSRVWECRIPVIAQVHGRCLAGGHRPRPPLRHHRGRRRRPLRVPARPVDGRAPDQHVALPPRPAVDQAAALHR